MKAGIVGCGIIASHHLSHVLRVPGIDSIAFADIKRDRAEALARRCESATVHEDLDSLLEAGPPDAVHVLTPPGSHARLAINAMDAGCHVLVEKPMALARTEAEAMVAAAERSNVRLCVDHNLVLDPLIQRATQLLASGATGRLVHVDASFAFDLSRVPGLTRALEAGEHWALDMPGGPIADYIPHPASLLLHFIGKPFRASTVTRSTGVLPDSLTDELRVLVDGEYATGALSVSLGARPDCLTVNLISTRMTIQLNLTTMSMVVRRNRGGPKKLGRIIDNLAQAKQLVTGTITSAINVATGRHGAPGDVGPVIRRFYRSIADGSEPPVTGRAGCDVAAFMEEVCGGVHTAVLKEVA